MSTPWSNFTSEALDKLEDKKMRDQLVDIITRIQELHSLAKADGRYDDTQVMRLLILGSVFIAFAMKSSHISALELKAILQREYDESFFAVREVVESIESAKAQEAATE